MRARRKAAGLKTVVKWVPESSRDHAPYSSHRLLEARSLAMHTVIAEKVGRDPRLLQVAHRNLARWRGRWTCARDVPRWMAEWEEILERPWTEVAALISAPTEESARLRQSSPFAGVLTPLERRRIYEAFRA
jgi:hypothetical protein